MLAKWKISEAEWKAFGGLLGVAEDASRNKLAAEACLFRHYHSLADTYRSFGWNALPRDFGISPATANRRYIQWTESGAWFEFWHALYRRRKPSTETAAVQSPVGNILRELERAYAFLNRYFFDGALPSAVAITVERNKRFLGQYRSVGKHHAIAISTHTLNQGAEVPLHALLHEMVHLRNRVAKIPDHHGRYHNRHFRDSAGLAGLDATKERYGYAHTIPNRHAVEAFRRFQPGDGIFVWPLDRARKGGPPKGRIVT